MQPAEFGSINQKVGSCCFGQRVCIFGDTDVIGAYLHP